MSDDSWSDYASSNDIDVPTRHEVMATCIADLTGFTHPDDLLRSLEEVAPAGEVRPALVALQGDAAVVDEAVDLFLSWRWDQQGGADQIRRAVADANNKMPVIELAVIGVLTMYGMYLLATGGKTSEEQEVERRSDGTEIRRSKIKYHSVSGPLKHLLSLFAGKA